IRFPARPSPQRLRGYQATVKVVRPPNRSDPYRLCNAAQYHRSSKTPIPSGLHRPHDPRKYPSYRDTYQDDSDKGITLPKCRMVDVFNWQMNPLNFVWDECLRILLTAFHFRQGPHIDDGFHAVIKHLIPTKGINPFKPTHPP